MYDNFRTVGISHQNSPLEIRELVAMSDTEIALFLAKAKDLFEIEDLMVLSTCNRTEVYFNSSTANGTELFKTVCLIKNMTFESFEKHTFSLEGEEAIRQLYKVALGLDSKVLGDIQIANQVRKAYQHSAEVGTAGPLLHRAMHAIFFANKRVVQETSFRDGAASTSYASVELIKKFSENFHSPKILVSGIGEIGRDVADNLKGYGWEVTLANRTQETAENVARILGFHTLDFQLVPTRWQEYDVFVSSAPLTEDLIHDSSTQVAQKLIIDLGVPRSIQTSVEDIPGVLLYNLDQISSKTDEVLKIRNKSIAQVNVILEEGVSGLKDWAQEMEISPTIKKLKASLENIRKEEISRYLKNPSDTEVELIDKISKGIIQKVMKLPVLELKAACKRGEAENLVEVISDLFDLEKETSRSR